MMTMNQLVEKKKKFKVDPNKPIKYLSAYTYYVKEKEDGLKTEYPDDTPILISNRLGASWSRLTKAERKSWQDISDTDKDRYKKEMKKWKAEQKAKIKEKKKNKR